MKKMLFFFIGLIATISISAQTYERQIGGGGTTCKGYWNEAKLDCSASSGICCLGEVVVTPKSFKILGTLLEKKDNDKIAEMAKSGALGKELSEKSISVKALQELLAGLSNRTLVLEKITFPPSRRSGSSEISTISVLIKKVNKSNKQDYVGHVTLLCRNCGDPLIKK